jgi:predicted amidohydrolase
MFFLTVHDAIRQGNDMKIAAVQMSAVPGDVSGNLEAIRLWTRAGAEAGCRLLLFPETSDLGYDLSVIANQAGNHWPLVRDTLAGLAREHAMALVCGVCLPGPAGLANALAAFGPDGQILALYRKIHLFSTASTDETKVFTPGNEIVDFDLDGIRFGLSICYDLRFPELFRVQALRGCQVLLLAAAWPRTRAHVWRTLCTARAMENQCFLLGANRVGETGAFPCAGQSILVSPLGETMLGASDREELLVGEMNPEHVFLARQNIPALAQRRPALYGEVAHDSTSSL